MAKKDDLSVNIKLGVDVDKASIDDANALIDGIRQNLESVNKTAKDLGRVNFSAALKKELGFGSRANVRVGGYSTGAPVERETANKIATKMEKLGGSWDGTQIADKAETAFAKNLNEAARELSQRLGMKFVENVAESINEKDFELPNPENLLKESSSKKDFRKKLQTATEDFLVDATGGVVISPAMLLAAAERVMKKNPNIEVPGNIFPKMGKIISPTPAFGDVAKYDPAVTQGFNKFVDTAIGENPELASRVSSFLESKLKVLFSEIIDAGQKARERTFAGAKVSEGEDAAANLVRYADDAARKAIAKMEERFGLQAGTTALYAPKIIPEKFQTPSGPEVTKFNEHLFKGMSGAVSDPSQLLNVLLGEYQDEVTGALIASLPDASQVAAPIAQILSNPYILGEKFAKEYETEIQKALKQKVKNPDSNVVQQIQSIAATELSTSAPRVTETGRGGALDPNLDLLRQYLIEQKALIEQQGQTFMAGLDTEFNSQINEKVTELGLVIQDGSGKLVEIFKFLQLPSDLEAMYKGSAFPPGNARTAKDLVSRGVTLGIPREQIGDAGDQKANFLQYREKMSKLVGVLDIFADLGVKLTGNSFKGAEVANIVGGIDYINKVSEKMGLLPLKSPNFGNYFDPVTASKQFSAPGAPKELRAVFSDEQGKASASLGDVISRIANTQPAWFKQFESQFRMNEKGTSFEYTGKDITGNERNLGAHVAIADAAASVIVTKFIKDFGGAVSVLLEPVKNTLNQEGVKARKTLSGGGGSKPPSEPPTGSAGKDMPDFGDRSPESILNRTMVSARELFNLVAQYTKDEKEKVTARLELLQKDTSDKGQVQTLIELAQKESALLEIRKEMIELSQKDAAFLLQRRGKERPFQGEGPLTVGQDFAQRSGRGIQGPLTESQTAFIDTGGMQRFDELAGKVMLLREETKELTVAARENQLQTIQDVKDSARKGHVTEELTDNLRKQLDANIASTQAGKSATAQIKGQMQEQANASKEAQRATQNLMNTWVTSRYALYDIGNFYTNIAQRLFQLSKQIFNTGQSFRRFETAFTSVERAMQLTRVGAKDLTEQFIKLSEEIPVTFEDIARIATLGAQMGINADGIVEFTRTVAEFSSITGMAAETVAQQFGRVAELADVDSSEYRNLGSAVAFAGINAVATEEEILKLAVGISAVSNQAGFSAQSIIGFSTALASVAIPAEQARGVFTRVFAKMDRSVSQGTRAIEKLNDTTGMTKGEFNQYDKSAKQIEAFAKMAGLSADEFSASWGPNGQSEQVFYQMLQGLNATTDLTKAFDELGIVNVRDINTLTRLAANLDVVKQALEDSGIAFEQGVFLGEAFTKTVDNVDSKLLIFKNNVDSLAAAFSENLAGGFGLVLDKGSEIIKFLKGASDSFAAMSVLPVGIFFTVAAAGSAAFLAVTKKLTAQLLAFRVAMVNAANDPTATQGLAAQVKQLLGLSSGVMEVRDQVSGGFGQKGLVQPFATTGLITDQKKLQAELLRTNNTYFALGDRVKDTAYAAAQGASTATDLARLEADQISHVVRARQLEIETLKQSGAASTVAGQQKIAQLTSQKIYVEFVDGEARALDEATFAEIRNAAASERTRGIKNGEAQARERNVVAVNSETSSAAKLGAGVGRVSRILTGLLGWAGIIISIASAVNMLFTAISKANEVDLIGSGGGLESLREAIAQDTRAFKEDAESALTTARVEYKTYTTEVDKAAVAIAGIVGANNMAGTAFNKVTEDVRTQTVAIGENTKEWFANAIMKNDKLQKWIEQDPEIFDKIQSSLAGLGVSFDDVLKDMVDAANGSNIDPLKSLREEIKNIEAQYDKLNARRINAAGPDVNVIPLNSDELAELDLLSQKLLTLGKTKELLESLGLAVKQTFAQSALWNAIKDALDISEESNAILDLVDAFKEASDSGKGMEEVIEDVKSALISMMPVAIAANDELEFDLNSEPTIQGLIEIVEGLIDTKKAAFETAMALYKLQPFRDSRPIPTLDIAEQETALKSLQALLVGAAVSFDSLGGAAESAADKLSRFISEANSGVRTLMDFRSAVRSLGKSLEENSSFSFDSAEGVANVNAVLSVLDSIGTKAKGNFPKAIREMQIFKLVMQDMGAPSRAIRLIDKAIKDVGGSTNLTAKQAAKLRKQFANLFNIFSKNMAAGAAEITNDVKDQIKTLTDFVSDLGSVLKSAFDIRYGKQIGLDAVSTAWMSLKDAAEAAEKAVKSANDEINQSFADRSILQYQLSVAERYKDEKRSVLIRAKLAKLDNQIVDQQKQLADANSANDKSLTGGTKAAIDNRAKVRDLVTQYNSYLIALANTGMTSTALIAEATKLETEFMAQAKALGFAEEELKVYTQAFKGDFTKVINGLPRDITLSVNTDPALRAIEEFVAKAQAALSQISMVAPTAPTAPTPAGQKPTAEFFNLGLPNTRPGPEIDGKKGDIVTGPKGATWAWDNKNKEWDKIARKAMGGYITKKAVGGYISGPGSATSDSIPAMLSNGEYVIQARAVGAYGLDFMNALNQQRVGFNPMQGSAGGAAGGSSVVYLSPEDRALLRAAVDRPIALYTENTRIAQSANAGNVLLAQRGTN